MKYLPTIARILLGLLFFGAGLAGLLMNPTPPPDVPEKAMAFSTAMMNTGYLFYLVKGTETICGALLLLNCFTPLALVILAPVILNITAFHLFLWPAPSSVITCVVMIALELYLAWSYRSTFKPLLTLKAQRG